MSRFTLAAGAALTVLLATLTGVLAGSRSRALRQVADATAALRHDIATHARADRLAAVLSIDLDGFKQINDQRGHAAGDAVLRTVAARMENSLRLVDTVARLGGDEFAILLEGLTTPADARVSASIGIALSRPGTGADELRRAADTAMYTANNTGKNRCVEATGPPPDPAVARPAAHR
ncbi:diguanylate cyclase domain-containing protein [Cryptosporangium phraense]|uniref:GGDEF domain-containing protein n=1 Tax=Cryptosporangium phraense TaxID=2593070 RepID=A0A545AVH4_9ACTN|nr:GGDEF domain-containing protein [Cryptosporangium phraense]TQS45304.1 GGDEF domain-containing protein [Cryptosporangium phraense]